jgi:N-acetylglucosaminyldiphosphoundecaprenol N-acetyl-beta-D-mannosaminyltransferase
METVTIQGIKIASLTCSDLNQYIGKKCNEKSKELVLYVNVHALNIAHKTTWFKTMLNSSYINICDGDGVRLGAYLLNKRIKEKITFNRWIWDFAEFSVGNNLSWYLVGSTKNVMNSAVEKLRKEYPKLMITGHHHGFITDKEVNDKLVQDIKLKTPNILIVGMGMPLQEKWLKSNFDDLEFNVALTAGAAFEYVAGTSIMTPNIFYKLKLEWFFRFLQEPRRLFIRYFIGNPLFMFRILHEKLSK